MKKVALSLLAFGLVGAMAFADGTAPTVAIHDWGRQLLVIGGQDSAAGNGYYLGLGTSWGSSPRIVGLNITADAGNAGFSITPQADNGGFGLTDQNKAWVKPYDGVTLEAGINLETDTWRGTADFGSYDYLRFPGIHGDSYTFSRIGEGGLAWAAEYNKDGIGAWALIQNPSSAPATNIGSALQAGAAYKIESIGTVKAQVLGSKVSGAGALSGSVASDEFSTYQVAFNLSAVENLYEEVGVWAPSDSSKAGFAYQFSDMLSYKLGAPTLHAKVAATGYNDKNGGSTDMGLEAGVGVDYAMDGGVGLGADFSYANKAARNGGKASTATGYTDAATTGIGVFASKGFANGMVGVGFEYSTTNWGGGNTTGTGDASTGHWAIPIKMEQWF